MFLHVSCLCFCFTTSHPWSDFLQWQTVTSKLKNPFPPRCCFSEYFDHSRRKQTRTQWHLQPWPHWLWLFLALLTVSSYLRLVSLADNFVVFAMLSPLFIWDGFYHHTSESPGMQGCTWKCRPSGHTPDNFIYKILIAWGGAQASALEKLCMHAYNAQLEQSSVH